MSHDTRRSSYTGRSGLLSGAQRDWVLGESDIEPDSERERGMRRRIQEKIERGITDMGILLDQLSQEDLEKVFAPRETEDGDYERPLEVELIDAQAFLYGACVASQMFPHQLVKSGVWEAYPRYRPERVLRHVTFEEEWDDREQVLKSLRMNLEDDKPLSAPQVLVAMESDEFSDDELLEIREHVRSQPEGSQLKQDRQTPTQPSIAEPALDELVEDAVTLDDNDTDEE